MKPFLFEMMEVLLEKGEIIKMSTFFAGKLHDASIVRLVYRNGMDKDYCFSCDFYDESSGEIQPVGVYRTDQEVELMTLKKVGNTWRLLS